ncbi:MAG TPA: 3D domain-containing protein [Bryobacteraceae bacterium]|nr:3D domain-containing protein [Bryobacteraceae bacterium]
MRSYLILFLVLLVSNSLFARAGLNGTYTATAYSEHGITASGEYTHRHVVAADPDVLPLGTRIKIKGAGRYSGEYVVADTGAKIVGRRLDIYMPSEAAAIKFGVHRVRVKIISLGAGTHASTKEADHAVKADVAKDVANGAGGGAATAEDVAEKKTTGKTNSTKRAVDAGEPSSAVEAARQDLPHR